MFRSGVRQLVAAVGFFVVLVISWIQAIWTLVWYDMLCNLATSSLHLNIIILILYGRYHNVFSFLCPFPLEALCILSFLYYTILQFHRFNSSNQFLAIFFKFLFLFFIMVFLVIFSFLLFIIFFFYCTIDFFHLFGENLFGKGFIFVGTSLIHID